MNTEHSGELLEVTVLVGGKPIPAELPSNEEVLAVIRRYLPDSEKNIAADYQLVDRRLGTAELPLHSTLLACGVKSGDVLAITKRDGGGGATGNR